MTLSVSALAVIGVTVVFSSFLSAVFGMAGGMILLGVLLAYLDVASAMILFSTIQFFVNGARVVQWRDYIRWPIFYWYVAGSMFAFIIMWTVAIVPDKATVYLLLGIMPFAIELLPAAARPNIEWRGVPVVTGFLTTVIQLLAGVGGLMLDIFFQKSMLDRKTTNATKAVTQSFSHIVRWIYFATLVGLGTLPTWVAASAVVLGIGSAQLAPYVIERMTDHGYRQWTRVIIMTISVIYLIRAAMLYWHG
jgi:uncharacterized membrane protein YfcA